MTALDPKIEERITSFGETKLFQSLASPYQDFVLRVAREYCFSQQELQQLTEISIDFSMWGDDTPPANWVQAAQSNSGVNAKQKKKSLSQLLIQLKDNQKKN